MMNTSKELQQAAVEAAQIAPKLAPEQQAQIEETARQLATSTAIPGVTTDMLDAAGGVLNTGMEVLGAVADVANIAFVVVEVAGNVVGAVADVVGSLDLGS